MAVFIKQNGVLQSINTFIKTNNTLAPVTFLNNTKIDYVITKPSSSYSEDLDDIYFCFDPNDPGEDSSLGIISWTESSYGQNFGTFPILSDINAWADGFYIYIQRNVYDIDAGNSSYTGTFNGETIIFSKCSDKACISNKLIINTNNINTLEMTINLEN